MPKTPPTIDEFLAALPADRRETMTALHKAIRKAAPKLAPLWDWVMAADAVGLSVLSGAHMTLFPEVMRLLKERGAGEVAVFGGGIIPDEDAVKLKELGVRQIFTPGASTEDIVKWVRENVAPRT